MIGAWVQTQWTLFYFPVCPCLCRYSVTSTPWAEGPPSSPVELWVSLSPFITHYLFIASWVISLWVLWWVEPSRSETPSISSLCLSTRSCLLSYFSNSPSITHPPLMISVHLLPHSVAHPMGGNCNWICCCLCQQFPSSSVGVAVITPYAKRHVAIHTSPCYYSLSRFFFWDPHWRHGRSARCVVSINHWR